MEHIDEKGFQVGDRVRVKDSYSDRWAHGTVTLAVPLYVAKDGQGEKYRLFAYMEHIDEKGFQVGDRVRVKDSYSDRWAHGTVTQAVPLYVAKDGQGEKYRLFAYVEHIDETVPKASSRGDKRCWGTQKQEECNAAEGCLWHYTGDVGSSCIRKDCSGLNKVACLFHDNRCAWDWKGAWETACRAQPWKTPAAFGSAHCLGDNRETCGKNPSSVFTISSRSSRRDMRAQAETDGRCRASRASAK